MEDLKTIPELKNGYFELPFTSVGIIKGDLRSLRISRRHVG
jgi:hypothetical protein